MQVLQSISIEYKTGLLFGIIALVFTLIIGIISGINFDVIAVRLLIMAPVYAGIGTMIVFVVKKFVPEFYALINSATDHEVSGSEEKTGSENESADSDGYDSEMTGSSEENGGDGESEFNEMNDDDLQKVETRESLDLDNPMDVSGRKLGKHIVATEKVAKYEPKVLAAAIRTMMSRNED